MRLRQIMLEKAEPESQDPKLVAMRPFIDKVCKLVFKVGGDWLADQKRGPARKYYGVAHERSVITDDKGKQLFLTLDNSTSSGEFELNSLSRLMIEKGSDLDERLKQLMKEHEVKTKKGLGYIERRGKSVVREVHLGVNIDEHVIRFATALIALLKHDIETRRA